MVTEQGLALVSTFFRTGSHLFQGEKGSRDFLRLLCSWQTRMKASVLGFVLWLVSW